MTKLMTAIHNVFQYPAFPQTRKHGPRGYSDYTSYKPWLRDDFLFRCAYCLTRERWRPDGQEGFSVDHFNAQSLFPQWRGDYNNLFYACCSCNAARREIPLPLAPSSQPLGAHLRIGDDGMVEPLTLEGAQFIAICHLNRPAMAAYRRRFLRLIDTLASNPTPQTDAALKELLGFPDNLPDLAAKRPPQGNARPEGLIGSCFERRRRSELPETY